MKKLSSKYEWYVVFSYDQGAHERGEVYSRHHTYEAARESAKKSGFDSVLAIKNYADLEGCQ